MMKTANSLNQTATPASKPAKYRYLLFPDLLKRMIARTDIQGAKASTFRDSYIKFLWEQGCSWNELKMATGIKNKKTLENKVKPEIKALEMVYKNICRGIKVPSINDKI